MKEKLVRTIIETVFILRYWVLLSLLGLLIYITWKIDQRAGIQLRDTVAVFTGGAVVITIFYHILNYEYAQRKFKYDIKASKDLLSFTTATEWHKAHMSGHLTNLYNFYTLNKRLLDDGKARKFHERLVTEKNSLQYESLLIVFNFMESICLGLKQSIMDEEFIKEFFKSQFITQYLRYQCYIEFRRRQKQDNSVWCNFTEIAQKWLS